MSNFNSADATESKGTSSHDTETTETDERHAVSNQRQPVDDDSVYRVHDGESITAAIVRAVGSEIHADPTGLQPLHSVVDTEALNELFASPSGEIDRTDGHIAFDYSGLQVRVRADETIQIHRPG